MDSTRIAALLHMTFEYYVDCGKMKKQPSEQMVKHVWLPALRKSGLPDEELERRLSRHMRESAWPPTVKDLIDNSEEEAGVLNHRAAEAWKLVVGELSAWYLPVFEDTVAAKAVEQIGGLDAIGQTPEKDLHFRRREFVEAYLRLAKAGTHYDVELNRRRVTDGKQLVAATYEVPQHALLPAAREQKQIATEGEG